MAPRSLAPAALALAVALALAACGTAVSPDAEELAELEAQRPVIAPPDAPAGAPKLAFPPPVLEDPIRIQVSSGAGPRTIAMKPGRDYVIEMPDEPVTRGLALVGGRNVVMIGGEIAIPDQGPSPSINKRRALHIQGATGTVHIEGVLMHGDDISEGIQTRAPRAVVQIQNVGIFDIRARDQKGFSDNHPDVIQTWGSVGELRVDGLTGETDYQGLFFKADYEGRHGPVHLRNVNIRGLPTARYLIWTSDKGGAYPEMTLDNVWVEPSPARAGGLGMSLWPDVEHPSGSLRLRVETGGDHDVASWPSAVRASGEVREGPPPGGDFVPRASVGSGYVSPGYEAQDVGALGAGDEERPETQ